MAELGVRVAHVLQELASSKIGDMDELADIDGAGYVTQIHQCPPNNSANSKPKADFPLYTTLPDNVLSVVRCTWHPCAEL